MADDARLQVEISAKIDKLIDGLNKAGTKIDAFSRSAYGAADRVRKAFDIDASRLDGPLKMLQLQQQLGVAQAAGNAKEAGALKEQIALIGQINALRRAGLSQAEAQITAERNIAAIKAAEALAQRAEGSPNFGAAARSVIDRSRFAVMEEGGAQLRVFGSALEPLGPLGFAAAAGVAAFAGAMALAEKSAEWADELKRTAEGLGETTTALQALQYASESEGVSMDSLKTGLGGLNDALGKVQDNLLRSKNAATAKAFSALGFSQEDLKGFKSASELLPEIADRIKMVRTAAEQTALARALGIEQLLPLLKKGGDYIRDLVAEAKGLGAIVPPETVDRMAELSDEMKKVDQRAGAAAHTLASAFIPVLVDIKTAAADAMLWLAKLLSMPSGSQSDQFAKNMGAGFRAQARAAAIRRGDAGAALLSGASGLEALTPAGREMAAKRQDAEAARNFGAARQFQAGIAPQPVTADQIRDELGHTIKDYTPATGGHAGGGGAMDDSAKKLAEAQEALLKATLRGTEDFDEQHKLHLQLIEAEYQLALAAADQEKNPATRQLLKDAAGKTRDANVKDETQRQQDQLRAVTDEILKIEEDDLAKHKRALDEADQGRLRVLGYEADRLSALAAIAKTTVARRDLAEKLLANEQERARIQLGIQARNDGFDPAGALADISATGAAKQTGIDKQFEGPIAKFADDANSANLGEQLQSNAVSAMTTLNSGLAEAIVKGGSLRDTLANVFKDFAANALKSLLEKGEGSLLSGLGSLGGGAGGIGGIFSALLHFIPGFADGTDSSPGGWKIVGERGPEAIHTGAGAKIVPNSILRTAAAAGNIRSGGRGVVTIAPQINFDMRGNSSTQEVQSMIAVARQQTQIAVLDAARRAMPGWSAQSQFERG